MNDIDNTKKCYHLWRNSGFWDGRIFNRRTLKSKATCGNLFKCDLCGEEAHTIKELAEKGGSRIIKK